MNEHGKKYFKSRLVKINKNVFLLQHTKYIQDTCVITNVKAIYAATDKEVIQAKEAPKLYARIPDTIDIQKKRKIYYTTTSFC